MVIRITIREANLSDTDLIAEFNSRVALETEQCRLNAEDLRDGVAALLRDAGKGVYFLAEMENEPGTPTAAGQLMLTYDPIGFHQTNYQMFEMEFG